MVPIASDLILLTLILDNINTAVIIAPEEANLEHLFVLFTIGLIELIVFIGLIDEGIHFIDLIVFISKLVGPACFLHLVLLDLRSIGMTGKVADLLVSDVNITANKNTVPFDHESPFVTSGLRLGTAALTTRGFDDEAFREVADVIADRLLKPQDESIKAQCLERVRQLCGRFPLYMGSL